MALKAEDLHQQELKAYEQAHDQGVKLAGHYCLEGDYASVIKQWHALNIEALSQRVRNPQWSGINIAEGRVNGFVAFLVARLIFLRNTLKEAAPVDAARQAPDAARK